jgi:DNA polymerase III delta subunit
MKKEAALDTGVTPHAAVFTGDDTVGREKAKAALAAAVLAEHPDATEEHYDPSTEHFDQFTTRIMTPSMFQQVRVFHVRHAEQLSDDETAEMARVIRYDIPDAYLMIEIGEDVRKDRANKILAALDVKAAVKEGRGRCAHYDFGKPPDYKIPDWLMEQVPRLFNRTIGKDDAAYLVECVGTDLDMLYSELQKIDIHLPSRAPVDKTAIEAISAATRSQTPFELARALGNRDLPAALGILDALFASTAYAPLLVSAIFRHFWGLYRIRAWAKANPDKAKRYLGRGLGWEGQSAMALEIGRAAGLLSADATAKKAYPVIILSRVVEQAQSFEEMQLRGIIRLLCAFDVDSKTGRIDAGKSDFEMLCYRIARAGRADGGE